MKVFDFQRVGNAFFYSMKGLKKAFQNETACQQELIMLFVLTPVACFMGVSLVEKILYLSRF